MSTTEEELFAPIVEIESPEQERDDEESRLFAPIGPRPAEVASSSVDSTPESAAKVVSLSRDLGVNQDVVRNDLNVAEMNLRKRTISESLERDVIAMSLATNQERVVLMSQDHERLMNIQRLLKAQQAREQQRFADQDITDRNIINPAIKAYQGMRSAGATENILTGERERRMWAELHARRDEFKGSLGALRSVLQPTAAESAARRERINSNLSKELDTLKDAEKELAELPRDVEFEQAMQDGLGPMFSALLDDPSRISRVTAEAIVTSTPSLVAGLLTGPIGAGIAGFNVEEAAAISDGFKRRGIDLSKMTEEQIVDALADGKLREELANEGILKGVGIGIVDMLSAGVASVVLAPARVAGKALSPVQRQATNLLAQIPVQGAFEGGGEALGQYLSTGDVNAVEVALEAIGGGGMSTIDVAVFGGRRSYLSGRDAITSALDKRARTADLQQREDDTNTGIDDLLEVVEEVKQTGLNEADPDTLKEYLQKAKEGGVEQMFVAPEAVQDYADSTGSTLDAVLDANGISREHYDDAAFRGGYVAIETERLVTNEDSTEFIAAVRNDAKTSYEGVTVNEAAALRTLDDNEFALAMSSYQDALPSDDGEVVYSDVFQQLMDTGRMTEVEARNNARLWQSTITSLASKAGTTPSQMYERFRPDVTRGAFNGRDNRTALLIQQLRARNNRRSTLETLPGQIASIEERIAAGEDATAELKRAHATLARLELEEARTVNTKEGDALAKRIDALGLSTDANTNDILEALNTEDSELTTFQQVLFHGTPHEFSNFSLDYIGTGEGVQAFGYGVYLAESEGIARGYQSKLAGVDINVGGQSLDDLIEQTNSELARDLFEDLRKQVKRELIDYPGATFDGADFLRVWLDDMRATYPNDQLLIDTVESMASSLEATPQGNLFRVEVPDSVVERMLDWDKPLTEQSPSVQNALIESGLWSGKTESRAYNGRALYKSLTDQLGNQVLASQFLSAAGIPGLKYLDGNSRAQGDGTRNLVVFEPEHTEILGREFNQEAIGQDHPDRVATRTPTSKKDRIGDPMSPDTVVGLEAAQAHESYFTKLAAKIRRPYKPEVRKTKSGGEVTAYSGYPLVKPRKNARDENVVEQFITAAVDNLLWLHDLMPAEIREQAKQWYVGANLFSNNLANRWNIETRQVAGVIAALSPQKDWFQNASLGERVIDMWHERQDFTWDEGMSATAELIFADEKFAPLIAEAQGKQLSELSDPTVIAVWMRAFDQTHNEPKYRVLTPEGQLLDYAKNLSGSDSKIQWGSTAETAKAVAILRDGSRENISSMLGTQHKVRSFYNNILAPDSSSGDVTIDTHAVAAAMLRPLSAAATEVKENFSGTKSANTGQSGLYPLYAEAYRRAAAERGILAREMQSITWEAVRGLFSASFKRGAGVDVVDGIWNDFYQNKGDINDVRETIAEAAGGITNPEWAGPVARNDEAVADSSYQTKLPGDELPAGDTAGFVSGAGSSDSAQPALITFETVTHNVSAPLHLMSVEERAEYTRQSLEALKLDEFMGLLDLTGVDATLDESTGAYDGDVNPNAILKAAAETSPEKLDLLSLVMMHVFVQDAVPWMQFAPDGDTQAEAIDLAADLDVASQRAFLGHLDSIIPGAGFTIIENRLVVADYAGTGDSFGDLVAEAVETYSGPGAEAFGQETTITSLKVKGNYHDITDYHAEGWTDQPAALETLEALIGEQGSQALRGFARSARQRTSDLNRAWASRIRVGADGARIGAEPSVREDGRVELTHWSRVEELDQLDPSFYGTGIDGVEAARQGTPGWLDRTYYGIDVDLEGGYKPERALDANRKTTSIEPERLYNMARDPDGLRDENETVTQYEERIHNAGYAGYWTDSNIGRVGALFEVMPIESQEKEFFQDTTDERRGSFQISDDRSRRLINLFESADASTFAHESAHFFLEVVRDLSNEGLYADADVDILFEFLDVNDWNEIETKHHEMFAEGFEKYLMEGNPPTESLRGVFRTFADWLRSLYKTAQSIGLTGVKLNDDIRSFYDRLVAGHEAIDKEALAGPYLPVFADAESAGMTEAEFNRYQKLAGEAVESARERIMKQLMKDITRRRTKERRELLETAKDEAREKMAEEPVWQALAYLRDRKALVASDAEVEYTRLDANDVTDLLGPDVLPLLPRITKAAGGMSPEVAAEMFGFRSGTEMLQAILGLAQVDADGKTTYPTFNQELNSRANAILDSIEETDINPERIRTAAADALHNTDRTEMLALELGSLEQLRAGARTRRGAERTVLEEGPGKAVDHVQAIADAQDVLDKATASGDDIARADAERLLLAAKEAQDVARVQRESDAAAKRKTNEAIRLKVQTFRKMARSYVEGLSVDDLGRLGKYLQDERIQSRKAAQAIGAKDYAVAAEAKQKEMWNHFVYAEAIKAREARDVSLRLFKRWQKTKPNATGVDNDYVLQIKTVLSAHNIEPHSMDPEAARTTIPNVATFVDAKNDAGEQIVVPDSVFNARDFGTISVAEMKNLRDAVRSLSKWGRANSQAEREAFQARMEVLAKHINDNVGTRTDREELGRIRAGLRDFSDHLFLSHRKAEHMMTELDGMEDLGPMWRTVYDPINEAANTEAAMRFEAMDKLRPIWERMSDLTSKDRTKKHVIAGLRLTREEMIVIGLNWGNEQNREALLNGSRKYSRGQLESVVNALTHKEWDFIEDVWTFINGYWGQISDLEQRMTGITPEKVEGDEFTLADGRVIQGQYYPIKFDPKVSASANKDAVQEQAKLLQSGSYSRAATRHGFTNARTGSKESGKRVWLSLNVMFRHVDEVMHDLSHREAVVQVGRVLGNRTIQAALAERYGVQVNQYLGRWLQNVAAGTVEPQDVSSLVFRHLRVGMSIAEMGLSLRTMLVQPAGITNTVSRIGVADTLLGLAHFTKDTSGNVFAKVEHIDSLSPYMKERGTSFDRDVAASARRLNPGDKIDSLRDMAFWGISKLDMMVSYSSWYGGYNHATKNGMNTADAVKFADQLVREGQGSGLAKDLADIQAGGEGKRILTAFYTFFAAYHNMVTDAVKRTGIIANKDGVLYATAYAANQFLWLVAMPSLVAAAALDGGPDDDEAWWAWAGKVVGGYGLSGMVWVRDAAAFATSDFGYNGPPVFRTVKEGLGFFQQMGQGEVDKALVRSGIMTVGYFAQLPSRQAWRSIEAIWDYTEGESTAVEATAGFAGLRHFKE